MHNSRAIIRCTTDDIIKYGWGSWDTQDFRSKLQGLYSVFHSDVTYQKYIAYGNKDMMFNVFLVTIKNNTTRTSLSLFFRN